jgi:hypothetical protein
MSQISALMKCKFSSPENAELAFRIYKTIYDSESNTKARVNDLAINKEHVEVALDNLYFMVTDPELNTDKNYILLTLTYSTREDDLEILGFIERINSFIEPSKIFSLSFNDQVSEWSIASNYFNKIAYIYGTGGPPNTLQEKLYDLELDYESLQKCIELYKKGEFEESHIRKLDEEAERKLNKHNSQINVGVNVKHKTFGNGNVIAVDGEGNHYRVQVIFESGETKWLATAYANLKVIK